MKVKILLEEFARPKDRNRGPKGFEAVVKLQVLGFTYGN